MKKILLIALLIFSGMQLRAGGNEKYVKAMESALAMMDTAKSAGTFQQLANRFERIGTAEKKQWLPYYYGTQCYIIMSYVETENDMKDGILDKAQEMWDKANELEGTNSELTVLQGMIYSSRIQVDPMARGMKFGPKAGMTYAKSVQQDNENPRAHYMAGQNTMFTPKQFGGGRERGAEMMTKAMEAYESFKPKSSIHPDWGKEDCTKMLEFAKSDEPFPWEKQGGGEETEEAPAEEGGEK